MAYLINVIAVVSLLLVVLKDGSAQDVVGMDLQLELPEHPDIHVMNDGTRSTQEVLEEIWGQLE